MGVYSSGNMHQGADQLAKLTFSPQPPTLAPTPPNHNAGMVGSSDPQAPTL